MLNRFKYDINKQWLINYMSNLNNLRKFAIKGILFGFVFTIITIILVPLALSIAAYIGQILVINESNLSLLESSLTIALLVVTAIYVYLTYQIVVQGENDRKIEFIERKLEKFYYPFLNFLKTSIDLIPIEDERKLLRFRKKLYNIDNRKSDPDYREFSTHKYLATKNINDSLENFFKIINQNQETKEKEHIDVYEKLIKDVEIDIEIFSKKLDDLVEPRTSHFEWIFLIFFSMIFYFIFMFLLIKYAFPIKLLI